MFPLAHAAVTTNGLPADVRRRPADTVLRPRLLWSPPAGSAACSQHAWPGRGNRIGCELFVDAGRRRADDAEVSHSCTCCFRCSVRCFIAQVVQAPCPFRQLQVRRTGLRQAEASAMVTISRGWWAGLGAAQARALQVTLSRAYRTSGVSEGAAVRIGRRP